MSIIFQQNKLFFFSDSLLSLVVLDETLEANGESRYISGGVHSVIAVDKEKNTWIFTVPTWQYLILTKDQATHIEGPQEYTESGATYVCLSICNSGGSQGVFTRQISSKAQLAHTGPIGEEPENA